MTDLPRVTGDRLGLVVGSSLGRNPFPVLGRVAHTVSGRGGEPVEVVLDDIGSALVLLRHGRDGLVPAHRVDHHAHVRALCAAGCSRVLALGSAGGLRPALGPGTVLVPDDFLALSAYPTFHDDTAGYATPGFDLAWRADLVERWRRAAGPGEAAPVDGGTYAQVRGPRFETPAEIRLLADYADVVGMTLASECVLAREAGLAHAALCAVDNLANGLAPGVDPTLAYREWTATGQPAFVARLGRLLAGLAAG